MRSFNEAAKPLYPLFWLFIISNCWAFFSPNGILQYDPRVFFMITGTIFSSFSVRRRHARPVQFVIITQLSLSLSSFHHFQCQLIVAQMTGTLFSVWNFQLVAYTISVLISIIPYQLVLGVHLPFYVEQWQLYGLVIVFSILHFYYGYAVVSEMCQHLGIKCFTVCARVQQWNTEFFFFCSRMLLYKTT